MKSTKILINKSTSKQNTMETDDSVISTFIDAMNDFKLPEFVTINTEFQSLETFLTNEPNRPVITQRERDLLFEYLAWDDFGVVNYERLCRVINIILFKGGFINETNDIVAVVKTSD